MTRTIARGTDSPERPATTITTAPGRRRITVLAQRDLATALGGTGGTIISEDALPRPHGIIGGGG